MDNAWFLSCSQPLNTSHPTQLTAEEKREHVEEQERCSKKYNAASKTWRAAEVKWKRDHTAWKAEFRRVFLTHFAQNATPWPPPSILSNLVSKLQDIESWPESDLKRQLANIGVAHKRTMVKIGCCMYQRTFNNTSEGLTQCLNKCWQEATLALPERPQQPGSAPKASDFGILEDESGLHHCRDSAPLAERLLALPKDLVLLCAIQRSLLQDKYTHRFIHQPDDYEYCWGLKKGKLKP
ncbi:hypothetical protein CPB85DRAFT_1255626 [Mucidula mucida]|nr:hypothetical protein CPB85DRAFT_1255626 [Mucidula mucida]